MRILILFLLSTSSLFAAIPNVVPSKTNIKPQSDIEYLRSLVTSLKEQAKNLESQSSKVKPTRAPAVEEFDNLEAKYFDDVNTKSSAPKRKIKLKRER